MNTTKSHIRLPDSGNHVVNAAALVGAAKSELIRAKDRAVGEPLKNIIRILEYLRASDDLFAFET